MIKCSKCNTLYSESAKVCLYCKIPLESASSIDESYFNFKVKDFDSEPEAEAFKLKLLSSEVPCVIRKEDNRFVVLIPENAKKNAFKPVDTSFAPEKDQPSNSKITIYIAFVLLFLIFCFLYYFSTTDNKIFFKNKEIKENIRYEGGTVDSGIIDKKSTLSSDKIKNTKEKKKVENPTPH